MKIGILSDSHNHRQNVLKAVDIFNEQGVDYVFHAGDMTSVATVDLFAELEKAKFIAVFGNCDSDKGLLQSTINGFGGEIHHDCYEGQISGKRILMAHEPSLLDMALVGGEFDLAIHGHTHKLEIRKVGQTLIINPGSLRHWIAAKANVVMVELDDMSTEVISLK